MADLYLGLMVLLIIALIGFIYYVLSGHMASDIENHAKKKQDERLEKSAKEKYGEGRWPFPAQELYQKCEAAKITDLNSAYAKSKVRAFAEEIMRSKCVPEKYWPLYNTDEIIEAYYLEGKALEKKEKERKAQEKHAYMSTAHDAALTAQQSETMSFYASLTEETGIGKRQAMLSKIISTITSKIKSIKDAQKSMQQLGVIMAQSAARTKPVDTAVAAGLAYGLGGTGAALYATADAMSRNVQIEVENRRNREAVNRMAVDIYSNASSLGSDIGKLEKQRLPYQKAMDELRTKVVIDGADSQELFKSLTIGKTSVEKLENGALAVKTELKTNYLPDVPDGVKTTVDGTLTGKVYAGDLFVGECIIPLPLFGVECGNPDYVEAETICGRFAANDKPYRVTFSPNNLWVMEL